MDADWCYKITSSNNDEFFLGVYSGRSGVGMQKVDERGLNQSCFFVKVDHQQTVGESNVYLIVHTSSGRRLYHDQQGGIGATDSGVLLIRENEKWLILPPQNDP